MDQTSISKKGETHTHLLHTYTSPPPQQQNNKNQQPLLIDNSEHQQSQLPNKNTQTRGMYAKNIIYPSAQSKKHPLILKIVITSG